MARGLSTFYDRYSRVPVFIIAVFAGVLVYRFTRDWQISRLHQLWVSHLGCGRSGRDCLEIMLVGGLQTRAEILFVGICVVPWVLALNPLHLREFSISANRVHV